MKIEKFYDPNWLCGGMFAEGEKKVLTIREIKSELVYLQGKGECRQPVLYFKEKESWKDENAKPILDKYNKPVIKEVVPLIIGTKTNQKTLKELFGEDTKNWVGKQITIYFDKTIKVGREVKGGLRISKIPPVVETSKCEVCGKDVNKDIWEKMKSGIGAGVCSAECKNKYLEDK